MSVRLKESDTVAQVGLLRLLSRILVREVDGELVRFLVESQFEDWFGLSPSDAKTWSTTQEEDAAVEFCRLFLTPGDCVPVASAFLGKS